MIDTNKSSKFQSFKELASRNWNERNKNMKWTIVRIVCCNVQPKKTTTIVVRMCLGDLILGVPTNQIT